MSCPEIRFAVTPEQYQILLAEAARRGVVFNAGRATWEPFEFDWRYDGASTLFVTCTHHPPIVVTCGVVYKHLRAVIETVTGPQP